MLAHVPTVLRAFRHRLPGLALRLGLAGATVFAGVAVAMATLPAADRLQDHATEQFGFGGR